MDAAAPTKPGISESANRPDVGSPWGRNDNLPAEALPAIDHAQKARGRAFGPAIVLISKKDVATLATGRAEDTLPIVRQILSLPLGVGLMSVRMWLRLARGIATISGRPEEEALYDRARERLDLAVELVGGEGRAE